ncbi:zinc finger protein 175 [Homo sapiens]|uniref:Zinc finger protein 175 n=1 Tax=Homo sapiens TaxID=9606 RepID=F5GZI7_HUMAN|nr:zinc finger protein 175 [Homo sapiens]KAI4044355.1 zinc finger protein 175 [Homo sapiens]
MPADVNLSQKPQVLGPEKQDGSCEVNRGSPGDSSPEREGRHRMQQVWAPCS